MNPEYSIFTITVRNLALLVCIPFLYIQNPIKTIYVVLAAFLYNLVATYLTGSIGEDDGRLTGIYYTTQLGQMAGLTCCLTSVLIEMQKRNGIFSCILFLLALCCWLVQEMVCLSLHLL